MTKPNEIRIERVYDAPVTTVWDAWVDPAQAAQWWGPRGFKITTHGKDFKVGGTWHYTMHGPDGRDYPNKTLYLEIEQNSRLVYDHGGYDDRPPLFRVTVEFSEIRGKTQMNMTMALANAEAADQTRQFIKQAGGDGTWDRLAEYLEKKSSGKEIFVINRTFKTSINNMYEMWVNPKNLAQWMGPTGATMDFLKADIQTGGSTLYLMNHGPLKMYGRTHYQAISPTRLVYTQEFCDENENRSRHPMAPTWPEAMLTNVDFTAEADDETRVTVTWQVYGEYTPEELKTFVEARAGMTHGWAGSFDKLDEYLKKSSS